jgi:predicted enzyme related to lactoylglutathione lyase
MNASVLERARHRPMQSIRAHLWLNGNPAQEGWQQSMVKRVRYVHTNLIARDWRKLADFYIEQFDCVAVPPERHFEGAEIEAGTAVAGAALSGLHLRLPGHGEHGPTLEIFTYSTLADGGVPAANRPGFGHLAFRVDSVNAAREGVLAAGGQAVGEVVTVTTSDGARITWCYVTDPEGNIIELQSVG